MCWRLAPGRNKKICRILSGCDRICMAYMEWELNRVSSVPILWARGLPRFPPSPTQPLRYDLYWLLGHSMLDALLDQNTNPTNQVKQKLNAVVGSSTYMDADRQEPATRNVRQQVR